MLCFYTCKDNLCKFLFVVASIVLVINALLKKKDDMRGALNILPGYLAVAQNLRLFQQSKQLIHGFQQKIQVVFR